MYMYWIYMYMWSWFHISICILIINFFPSQPPLNDIDIQFYLVVQYPYKWLSEYKEKNWKSWRNSAKNSENSPKLIDMTHDVGSDFDHVLYISTRVATNKPIKDTYNIIVIQSEIKYTETTKKNQTGLKSRFSQCIITIIILIMIIAMIM